MAKLYVNENFPLPAVYKLRELGHDVLTSLDAGKANQSIPDDEVLKFSISIERIFLTLNRKDFIKLHKITPKHTGIIVCTEDADFIGFAQRIHELLEKESSFSNQLFRVYRLN